MKQLSDEQDHILGGVLLRMADKVGWLCGLAPATRAARHMNNTLMVSTDQQVRERTHSTTAIVLKIMILYIVGVSLTHRSGLYLAHMYTGITCFYSSTGYWMSYNCTT